MKRISILLECLQNRIKKYFFKYGFDDENQACEQLKEMIENEVGSTDSDQTEEYLLNYSRITRWQTL